MDSLPKQILAEIANVEAAIRNLEDAISRRQKTVVELAAIATFLHNFYSGIENILKQSLGMKNIRIPKSENWHKELLRNSVDHEVISETLSDELYEYLCFRHFFVHAYGFMLEEAPLEELSRNVPRIWQQFISEIERETPGRVTDPPLWADQ